MVRIVPSVKIGFNNTLISSRGFSIVNCRLVKNISDTTPTTREMIKPLKSLTK
jgi:hypothetical protein